MSVYFFPVRPLLRSVWSLAYNPKPLPFNRSTLRPAKLDSLGCHIFKRNRSNPRKTTYALLIDGDSCQPSSWKSAVDIVSRHGALVSTNVFCTASNCQNKKWMSTASLLNINLRAVPRRAGGAKDPNDMAIAMEAARMVCSGETNSVALAVADVDFVHVAEQLHNLGHSVLVVLPEACSHRLAQSFQAAHAHVVRFADHLDGRHAPKKRIVLHQDGEGSVENVADQLHNVSDPHDVDEPAIAQYLCDLQYLSSLDDPIVPGIAKFFFANRLGPLTVWPTAWSIQEAAWIMTPRMEPWKKNPGNLIFTLPCANGKQSAKSISKFGSINAGRFACAGGPFMIRDSEGAVETFLKRLGYLDDKLNPDISEAIDIFARIKLNKRSLSAIGLSLPVLAPTHTKLYALHTALVSCKSVGVWQLPPSDAVVRQMLVKAKQIPRKNAPADEVFLALKQYCKNRGLEQRRTYNGLVMEVLHDNSSNAGNTRE